MELKKEKSCGCIIINEEKKVLLVYEKTRNFWGFPKGHVEAGENEEQTARREVKEETGIDVEIDISKRYVLNYIIKDKNIDKTTVLFLAKPVGSEKITMQEEEIENAKWCSIKEAQETISFDNAKEMFARVIKENNL